MVEQTIIDLSDRHPTPDISNRHQTHVVRLNETAVGEYLQQNPTDITLNHRYKVNQQELLAKLYLPGFGQKSETIPLPRIPLSRGRETGNSLEPVLITKINPDGSEYQVIGVIGLKGYGPRNFESTHQTYRGGSNAVLGETEIMIDSNMGDMLSEDGATIGDTLAILSVPQSTFLESFENTDTGGNEGHEYAQQMREFWKTSKEDRRMIHGLVRLTDPERLDPRTFFTPILLNASARWLHLELMANGTEAFLRNYQLPTYYVSHLSETITDYENIDTAKHQAELLVFIITRNYAICLNQGVNTSFSQKDIGNLGKLHDFPISLDVLDKNEKGELVVDPSLGMTRGSFKSLVNDIFLAENSLLQPADLIRIAEDVELATNQSIKMESLIEPKLPASESPFTITL